MCTPTNRYTVQATKATKKSKPSKKSSSSSRYVADEDVPFPEIETEPLSEAEEQWIANADPQTLFTKSTSLCQDLANNQETAASCLAYFVAFTRRYPQFNEVIIFLPFR